MPTRSRLLSNAILALFVLGLCKSAFADQDKVLQFINSAKRPIGGQDHLVVFANLRHGRYTRLVIANSDPAGPFAPLDDQAQLVVSLKGGDLIQASWDTAGGISTISAITHYTPKPGELTPNGYIFVKSETKDQSSELSVTLQKLGDVTKVLVPAEKDESGQMVRDPLIDSVIADLHEGDPVWVDLSTGAAPKLLAILPYADPTPGTLVKIDTTDLDGASVPTAEINDGKLGVPAVFPGKTIKGKWVPYSRLVAAAHRCKAGTPVVFRIQRDATTTWLRDIQPQQPDQPVAQNHQQPLGRPDNGSPVDANGVPKGRTVGGANLVPSVGDGFGIGGF